MRNFQKYRYTIIFFLLFQFFLILIIFNVLRAESSEEPSYLSYALSTEVAVEVGNDETIYEKGMILDDLEGYFYEYQPVVIFNPYVELSRNIDSNLIVYVDANLFVMSTDNNDGVYWKKLVYELPENRYEVDTLKSYFEPVEIDISDYYDYINQIIDELGSAVGVRQVVLDINTKIEGIVDNFIINKELSESVYLTLQQDYFYVSEDVSNTSKITLIEDVTVSESVQLYNKVMDNAFWYVVIDSIMLGLMFISLYISNRQKSSELREHRKFKEWITEGSIEISDRTSINITSLVGLVDLAIDLDKRVIYDKSLHKYYVIEEDVIYQYNPKSNIYSQSGKLRLGEYLVSRGIINEKELEIAAYYSSNSRKQIGETLVELGIITETDLHIALSYQHNYNFIDLENIEITDSLSWIDDMPLATAIKYHIAPLGRRENGQEVVATILPLLSTTIKEVNNIFGENVQIVATTPTSLHEYLGRISNIINPEVHNSKVSVLSPRNRLSKNGLDKFRSDLKKGKGVNLGLFLVAMEKIPENSLKDINDHSSLRRWMMSKNNLSGTELNLLYALRRIEEQTRISNEKGTIDILDLLIASEFLMEESALWIRKQVEENNCIVHEVLIKNFYVTQEVVIKAEDILCVYQDLI